MTIDLIRLLFGIVLLAFGRRLYWLLIAAAGFVAGLTIAPRFFPEAGQWVVLVIAVIGGLIGAGLALLLQNVAIALAGFAAGGYIAVSLVEMAGISTGGVAWLPFLIGGVLGTVLVGMTFDWALILLTALAGARLVVQGLGLVEPTSALAFVVLAVIGFIVQAGLQRAYPARTITRRESRPPPSIRR